MKVDGDLKNIIQNAMKIHEMFLRMFITIFNRRTFYNSLRGSLREPCAESLRGIAFSIKLIFICVFTVKVGARRSDLQRGAKNDASETQNDDLVKDILQK